MKPLLLISFCILSFAGARAQIKIWEDNAEPLYRAEKTLTAVLIHDIFSPPDASRIYLYANIAAYEILAKKPPHHYQSLFSQINSFPQIPDSKNNISFSLASVYAYLLVGKKLVFSELVLEDSIHHILQWYRKKHLDKNIYDESLKFGSLVAGMIIRWAEKDHYKETRKLFRYSLLKEEGKWLPTPPGYMAAVEPHWNRLRPITLDSSNQFRPPPATSFNKDSGSLFYKLAYEVYQVGNKLSDEQKLIASFWDCNPFALNTEGHLNFASKKMSPGAHWISIVGIVSKKQNMPMIDASAAYTLTAIALFDAFISCWDEKYRSNTIRPETYINAYIDESWRPLLQTPPFPEYTSGHSVISAAAAVILTRIFGDSIVYDDNSEMEFGLPPRSFRSFEQASNEAAISRLYGGIHYRPAIENGQVEGRLVGEWVLHTIHLVVK